LLIKQSVTKNKDWDYKQQESKMKSITKISLA